MRQWCKKIEIEIFDKWLISLDHVTNVSCNLFYDILVSQKKSTPVFCIKSTSTLLWDTLYYVVMGHPVLSGRVLNSHFEWLQIMAKVVFGLGEPLLTIDDNQKMLIRKYNKWLKSIFWWHHFICYYNNRSMKQNTS